MEKQEGAAPNHCEIGGLFNWKKENDECDTLTY